MAIDATKQSTAGVSPDFRRGLAATMRTLMNLIRSAEAKLEAKIEANRKSAEAQFYNVNRALVVIADHPRRTMKTYVANALTPFEKRVERCESKTAAVFLCMSETDRIDVTKAATRIGELEARIAALEQQPAGLKYMGQWRQDTQANANEFWTDRGSVWHCKRATRGRPGDCEDFQLAVKKGADAR